MDRISFRVTALLATACLAIASSDAYADPPVPPSDPGASATVPPAPEEGKPTLATEDDSDESPASGDVLLRETDSGGASAQQDGAFPEEVVPPSVSDTAGDSVPPATGTPKSTPAAPAAQGVRADQVGATPPAAVQPLPAADPPTGQTPPFAAAPPAPPKTAAKPGPVAPVTSKPAAPKPGNALERRLSGVGRGLRDVQEQIHDLRRGLADGAPPPASRLHRLRATLVRVTPMVSALEVRLQAAGRLSPHLRHLLRGVRGDLQEVHVAAAGLVAALRGSGARSTELRLLLRELEAFLAVGSTLAPNPGLDQMPASAASVPGGSTAPTQLQPIPATSPTPNAAGPPAPRAESPDAPGPSHAPAGAEVVPSSAAPGSATAGPAGSSFFFAAVAGIMALLLGIALPALWARLDLPPGRPYAAAFLTPLERPG